MATKLQTRTETVTIQNLEGKLLSILGDLFSLRYERVKIDTFDVKGKAIGGLAPLGLSEDGNSIRILSTGGSYLLVREGGDTAAAVTRLLLKLTCGNLLGAHTVQLKIKEYVNV